IGGVLLINLVTAHYQRFSFTRNKAGIWMVHLGLILLLVGQLGTDLLSQESSLHLREGQTKNYSETQRQAELAVMDTTDAEMDTVAAIRQGVLRRQKATRHAALPFTIRIKSFFANSQVANRKENSSEPPAASQGIGPRATVRELPRVTETDIRDVPAAVIEI